MDPLFPTFFNWAEASDDELAEFIAAAAEVAEEIGNSPDSFVTDERPKAALLDELREGVAAIEEARAELASRTEAETPEVEVPTDVDVDAEIAELALTARGEAEPEPEDDPEPDPEPEPEAAVAETVVEPEPVVAAAPPAPKPLPRPARSIRSTPQPAVEGRMPVSLTAAAGVDGYGAGDVIDALEVARAMIKRRYQFGLIPEGTSGEQMPIARLGWEYPDGRRLTTDYAANMATIAEVTDPERIKAAFKARRDSGALTASGGLCAPVTPYYNLQMISVADRPVRAALPGFNADRGGVRVAAPAGLGSVTTGVGIRTVAEDYAGGTEGAKTCQVIDCPAFTECDVDIIFHCLQFGNLGARAFPELVAQWNNLVLASFARTAETNLLDGIDAASTQVTAATIGLGAAAELLGEILVAAAAMRSRNRMDSEAVLRLLLPRWTLDLLVSDTYRTQFGRFDMDAAAFIAQLRKGNVEPTFYIDGATGNGQVFGAQNAGALLAFPTTTTWYLYPEGSFLYLDGGTLELGLVRDSVLNASNDFQVFGESFEGVCFVGVESLAVTSTICDNGAVSLPIARACPVEYSA